MAAICFNAGQSHEVTGPASLGTVGALPTKAVSLSRRNGEPLPQKRSQSGSRQGRNSRRPAKVAVAPSEINMPAGNAARQACDNQSNAEPTHF